MSDVAVTETSVPTTKPAKTNSTKIKPKKRRKKGASLRRTARRLVVKNPTITLAELHDALTKQGFKSTKLIVGAHRNSVRGVLRLLVQEGMLTGVTL
jgi:hypothetical protein